MGKLYALLPTCRFKRLFLFMVFLVFINILRAQTGVLDRTFGTGGKVTLVNDSVDTRATAVIMQPDGKLVVAGSGDQFQAAIFYVARYNSNGTLDATFGTGGIVSLPAPSGQDAAQSLALQPDGKIVLGGFIHNLDTVTLAGDADFFLARLQSNGRPDSTFGTNGIVLTDLSYHSGDVLYKVIIKPDGKILAGGYVNEGNTGNDAYGLVQYKPNGALDSTFGTNGISVTFLPIQQDGDGTIELLPNGKILAAMTFVDQTSFFYEFGVARFNANGSLDVSYANAGTKTVSLSNFHSILHGMAIQADGKPVLVGEVQDNVRTNVGLVRLDSTGAIDNGFGINGQVHSQWTTEPFSPDGGTAVQIQPDGKILVGGTTDNSINSMDANFGLARYEVNGSIDDTFGKHGVILTDFEGGGDFSRAMLLQPDGKVVLVGSAETINGTGFAIARYERNARLYYNSLKGSVFVDNNSNGTKDANEVYFTNATVTATRAGLDTLTISSSSGRFDVDIDTGQYVVSPSSRMLYYTAAPAARNINHSSYFNTDSISFGMQPIPGMRDVAVYLIPLNPARPGFGHSYEIMYINKGTDTIATGSVQLFKNSNITFNSSTPTPNIINGDTLIWNFSNLLPRDTGFIIVHGTVLPPPATNIGDILASHVDILPVTGDRVTRDNVAELGEEVVGSFDPNDKAEKHGGKITQAQVADKDYLQYTVRFQNTGTDTAFNIYVRDTLSTKLDWSTFEMVAASHSYSLSVDDGKCLWSFNNIRLVDSNANEPKSHGYIVYRIKPKNNLILGDKIDNTASIYFDYNLPVRTNTERTTVVANSLPLKLLAFNARKSGRVNLLNWSTTNEIRVSHFVVERSTNGREFSGIGRASAGLNNYSFTDNNPAKAINYYRLKMIDRDGSLEYSPVRAVNNNGSFFVNIYPNPTKEKLNLQFDNDKKAMLQLQVAATDGKIVLTRQLTLEAGITNTSINVSQLHAGTYVLKVTSAEREHTVITFSKL